MIWISGATGLLGHAIRAELTEKNIPFLHDRVELTDKQAVQSYVGEHGITCIINCAAWSDVDSAEKYPEQVFAVNRDGPAYCAAAAQSVGARMIHISTDYVFDGTGPETLREWSRPAPANVYGASKLAGEKAVQENCSRAVVLRTSWLYGAGRRDFVDTVTALLRERTQLTMVDDQLGSPTWTADLARFIRLLCTIESLTTGVFHYSNRGCVSRCAMARVVREELAAQRQERKLAEIVPCSTQEMPRPARRPAFSCLNPNKTALVYGIDIPHWRDSLRRCIRKNGAQEIEKLP
ncbi:MAG: dTDP-4-dehydrorhamnose reductase [Fibrobacterota bacterium]